ncbi:hypothetical protein RTBOTA2_001148 [Rhodotorula toruloides]|nr:hypothetical protein RTBOTA2_001148 [Rhodotorula toruloides]
MSDSDTPPASPPGPPEESVLPPWIWLTLCTISLFCLLFISFRRAKSLELYERAKDYLRNRLSFSRMHRGIHLSERDLEADPLASPSSRRPHPHRSFSRDDASDVSSVHSLDDDELPAPSSTRFASSSPFPSRRAYQLDTRPARSLASSAFFSFQSGLSSAADALGWSAERATSAMRGEGQKGDGFARAFWGLRKNERTGGIRLGEGSPREDDELRGVGGKAARVLGISSSPPRQTRTHRRSDSVATDGSGALFEVGDEEDGADAVELPAQFSLGSGGRGGMLLTMADHRKRRGSTPPSPLSPLSRTNSYDLTGLRGGGRSLAEEEERKAVSKAREIHRKLAAEAHAAAASSSSSDWEEKALRAKKKAEEEERAALARIEQGEKEAKKRLAEGGSTRKPPPRPPRPEERDGAAFSLSKQAAREERYGSGRRAAIYGFRVKSAVAMDAEANRSLLCGSHPSAFSTPPQQLPKLCIVSKSIKSSIKSSMSQSNHNQGSSSSDQQAQMEQAWHEAAEESRQIVTRRDSAGGHDDERVRRYLHPSRDAPEAPKPGEKKEGSSKGGSSSHSLAKQMEHEERYGSGRRARIYGFAVAAEGRRR